MVMVAENHAPWDAQIVHEADGRVLDAIHVVVDEVARMEGHRRLVLIDQRADQHARLLVLGLVAILGAAKVRVGQLQDPEGAAPLVHDLEAVVRDARQHRGAAVPTGQRERWKPRERRERRGARGRCEKSTPIDRVQHTVIVAPQSTTRIQTA